MKKHYLLLFLITILITANAQKKITFPSLDGLTITADLYINNDTLPYMILCHQAGYSRGEYKETAITFTQFGFNCLAIDARSGDSINGVKNETAALAKKLNKPTTYLDAEQDIIAAINYIYKKSHKKVILVGSSYSASLVLKIGTTNDKVRAVLAFSPGEYFGDKLNLKEAVKTYNKPLFVTSSYDEYKTVFYMLKEVPSKQEMQFVPSKGGKHGSKALWDDNPNHAEYWMGLTKFMKQYLNSAAKKK